MKNHTLFKNKQNVKMIGQHKGKEISETAETKGKKPTQSVFYNCDTIFCQDLKQIILKVKYKTDENNTTKYLLNNAKPVRISIPTIIKSL